MAGQASRPLDVPHAISGEVDHRRTWAGQHIRGEMTHNTRSAYYQAHEREYLRRLRAGDAGSDAGPYDAFFVRPFVLRMLAESGLDARGGPVLELGCGTGSLACLLAARGLEVVAVDVSAAAIGYGREIATQRGLTIDFRVHDVVGHGVPDGAFDLVIDAHLLHCLVSMEHRAGVLRGARQALSPGGEFWIETMAMTPAVVPDPAWHLDAEGVTWAPLGEAGQYAEEVQRDGQVWLPIRRIREPEAILEELSQAGLRVLWRELEERPQPHTPAIFRARCAVVGFGLV